MKRTIYIFLALSVLFNAACTEIDPGTVPQQPESQYPYIFFDAEVASGTKSNLVEEEALPSDKGTSFGVFGYRGDETVFDNVKMYRPSKGAAFIYDYLVTWTDESHDFYAYYPYGTEVIIGYTEGYIQYAQPTSLESMVDILTATALDQSSTSNPVSMSFQHRLFALDITVKNSQEYCTDSLIISGAKVVFHVPENAILYYKDINNDGVLDYVNDDPFDVNWSCTSELKVAQGSRVVLNDSKSFLFLPCNTITVGITLTGRDEWGDFELVSEGNVITPVDGFKAGQRYTLEITKKDATGFVASLISGWTDIPPVDFTFK